MTTIYVNLTRQQVRDALAEVPGIVAGTRADPTGAAKELLEGLGLQFLSLVKRAFIEKSRGGTDAAGIKWAPLKRETVAYSRRHPGRPKGRRPLLTPDQDKRWKQLYAGALRGILKNGGGIDESKRHAAAYAWMVTKDEGGKTVLGEYGDTPVEILSDTGRLFNSLSSAIIGTGAVGVGTNVEYAGTHHYGDPSRGVPSRPLWPEPEQVPQPWIDSMLDIVSRGLEIIIRRIFGA